MEEAGDVVAVAEVDPAEVEEVDVKSNAITMVITILIDLKVQCHQEHTNFQNLQLPYRPIHDTY